MRQALTMTGWKQHRFGPGVPVSHLTADDRSARTTRSVRAVCGVICRPTAVTPDTVTRPCPNCEHTATRLEDTP